METILPALLGKYHAETDSTTDDETALHLCVKPVMQVFVDALFHIPKHRRLGLFTILVSVLGESQFLQPIISLLLLKAVGTGSVDRPTASAVVNKGVLDFASIVASKFTAESQLKMLYRLLRLTLDTPSLVDAEPSTVLMISPRYSSVVANDIPVS